MSAKRSGAVVLALVVVLSMTTLLRPEGEAVRVVIPSGATLAQIAEILEEQEVIGSARLFYAYARARRADRKLKAGTYRLPTHTSMRKALIPLTRGQVETVELTIPEGYQLHNMAEPIAEVTGLPADEILRSLREEGLAQQYGLPGPTIEGYLFPDTYRFASGVPLSKVVEAMVDRYREVWTVERQTQLEESGRTEREIVTLASIIQAEARQVHEMPRISGVYHNRLAAGWLLQADPTVLYALGGYRERLLYAAIDSVEDNPYNTYSNRGLPPGPIGSPGELAIEAALSPEEHDFMYFVAWPDGSHEFTRSLAEHNAAKEDARIARQNASG